MYIIVRGKMRNFMKDLNLLLQNRNDILDGILQKNWYGYPRLLFGTSEYTRPQVNVQMKLLILTG